MGFDYYVMTELKIVFNDEKCEPKFVHLSTAGGYLTGGYDPDEETEEEACKREMADHEKLYPPKLVFADGAWKTKIHETYERQLKKIDLATVLTIHKVVSCFAED